jgi:septal ring factor EnvC (AmiA/AmiB activator)
MPRTSVIEKSSPFLTHVPWYPESLLHQLQATLSALADIEARYEAEREHLEARMASATDQSQSVADLDSRRETDRQPYVQLLAELHHRMMSTLAYQDICESD